MIDLMRDGELLDLEVIRELADVTADSGCTFLRSVLESFAADARGALRRMHGHARIGDATALAREAHRLRAAAAPSARFASPASASRSSARRAPEPAPEWSRASSRRSTCWTRRASAWRRSFVAP